ncbi:MAG TPA: hypothetical protein VGJ88_10075 [Thermoanaerobaculia bacterium]
MKKLLAAVLLLTSTALAGPSTSEQAATAAREKAMLRAVRAFAPARGAHPTAALTTGYDQWIFIPAAGSVSGNFGTFYKSDLMIANYRNQQQRIRLRWIPQGTSGFLTTTQFITMPANTALALNDVVAQTMHYSGLGSLELVARLPDDSSIDLNAQIDAFSRIYTPQPNTTLGTVSQNFGGSSIFQIEGSGQAFSLGLRQDATFRTNVGILNADFSNAHTWTVQVVGTAGSTSFTISVPAFSMIQTNIPSGNYGNLYVIFTPPNDVSDIDSWTAYASSTDNGTGDGWVSPATQITNQ